MIVLIFVSRFGNVRDVIDEVYSLVKSNGKARDIKIIKRCGRNLPKIKLDNEHLIQALVNFVNNSLDAISGSGKVSIQAKHQPEDDTISISDNGKGLSSEDVKSAFEPFFTTKKEGIGLGLPVSKQIIEAHGGDVVMESRLNKGTKVTVKLPLLKKDLKETRVAVSA